MPTTETPSELLPVTWRGRFAYLVAAILGLVVVGLTVASTLLVVHWTHPPAFDPLTADRDQAVFNRVKGVRGAALRQGDLLSVTGTKCNASKHEVKLRGQQRWQTTSPPGNLIDGGSGVGALPPGCTTRHFENSIPPRVVEINRALRSRGIKPIWVLTGTMKPLGENTVERTWRTQPFQILPAR